MKSPHLILAKELWEKHVQKDDLVIDATCGNGHDTLFLAKLPLRQLIAIDLQKEAIEATRAALEKELSPKEQRRVLLKHQSHQSFEKIEAQLIVYNLGYLPKGNKAITTKVETTLQSVHAATQILAPNGALSITCYPGHEEGAKEKTAILQWATNLPSDQWSVCHHEWVNRPSSPSLFWIVYQP
jgi:tRNA1(Val) A37 N6-methylase TrmN6